MRKILTVIPLALLVSGLAAASHLAAPAAYAVPRHSSIGDPISPTPFDFLVLAGIADSAQPFAVAGYHSRIERK